jgi:SAM-dependent methyltransferase
MSGALYETQPSTERTPADGSVCPVCGQGGGTQWMQAPDRFHGRTLVYELLRCSACSFVWLANPPRPEEMEQHYGPDYDQLIMQVGEADPDRWKEPRKTLLQHKSSGALLDLGCSSGSFLGFIKGPSWKLYGIEISPVSAKRAEARSGGQIYVGNVPDASFPAESFDAITCFHVLEHMYNPREVLSQVSRWLKPGGIFFVLVPNIDSGAARFFGSYWYGLELPRHLFHYSPQSLRVLAKSVGLREVSMDTFRVPFIGYSTRYINDEILKKIGLSRRPLAMAKVPSIPFRIFRKAFRLTVLPILNRMVGLAGPGEIIQAIFTKGPVSDSESR